MIAIISLTALGIITLFLGITNRKKALLPVILVGLLLAMAATVFSWGTNHRTFNDMLVVDNYAVAFNIVMIFSTFLIFMFAGHYYRPVERPLEDVYAVMIFALVGSILMTSFGNLIMLFLGIETLSIAVYILAGSHKESVMSNEATLKYFLTGSFISCFLIFGIALIYGASGTFHLHQLAAFTTEHAHNLPKMFLAGLFLVIIGLSFKIAIAPFHFWAPDVYEGTPTLLTAFMATVIKTAGIVALYRLFSTAFPAIREVWEPTLWVLALLTIFIGNLTGLYQPNFKRMLAYSSISHSGYMILAVLAFNTMSANALLFYSVSYSLSTIAAFGILILIREAKGNDAFTSFYGLGRKYPVEAFCLTIAMLSLTGIPPLAGFMAKYFLFTSAIGSGLIWLTVLAIIGSAISAAYYLKPVIGMYMREGEEIVLKSGRMYRAHLIFITVLTILVGILPFFLSNLL